MIQSSIIFSGFVSAWWCLDMIFVQITEQWKLLGRICFPWCLSDFSNHIAYSVCVTWMVHWWYKPCIMFFKFRLRILCHADFMLIDQLVNLLVCCDTKLSFRQRITVPIVQVTLSFPYILYSVLIQLHWLSDFHELLTCLVY